LLAAALVIAVAAVIIAGCSGTPKNENMLIGADIFDPARFGMAIYDVTLAQGDSVAHQGYIVSSNTTGADGYMLTSVSFHDNLSKRADTLISRDRKKTVSVAITDINGTGATPSGGSPLFQMTTIDESWNALDTQYSLDRTASVTVPAGTFDCKVYGSNKTVVFGSVETAVQVFYYMNSSVAVPVMFEVKSPAQTYTYRLEHVYEPGDTASTPELVVQSFFDDLRTGRLDDARECLVTYDNGSNSYKAPDDAAFQQFLAMMNSTYLAGASGYRNQFVYVTAVTPITSAPAGSMVSVEWNSVNYQISSLNVFRRSGSFNVTEADGRWRIIV
jgi:hypothetical protein